MSGLFGRLALFAGIAAAVLVVAAGPAYRYGYAELPMAFEFMRYGVYAAGAAVAFAVLWVIFALVGRSKAGFGALLAGVVLAVASAYVPINMQLTGASVPPIHDITTDTVNPPVFVSLMDARLASKNGADYKPDNAAEQQKAYPDIVPLITDVAPGDMFVRAENAARAMGWEIAAAVPEEGRIEATETTQWWGFKDDVVIRITAESNGSRLDIRSMSRVGISDLGKNAERIRKFLAAVREAK